MGLPHLISPPAPDTGSHRLAGLPAPPSTAISIFTSMMLWLTNIILNNPLLTLGILMLGMGYLVIWRRRNRDTGF